MKDSRIHWDFPDIPENEWMFKPNFDTSEDEPGQGDQGKGKKENEDTTSQ